MLTQETLWKKIRLIRLPLDEPQLNRVFSSLPESLPSGVGVIRFFLLRRLGSRISLLLIHQAYLKKYLEF